MQTLKRGGDGNELLRSDDAASGVRAMSSTASLLSTPCWKCKGPKETRTTSGLCYACKAAFDRDSRTDRTRARERDRWRNRKADPVERHKFLVRKQTRKAIAAGTLTRLPCEVCGRTIAEAHHDDYSKPLEVRWLCPHHHRQHHLRANKEAA